MQSTIGNRVCIVFFCVVALAIASSVQAGYITTITADNPVGYWRLDETSGTSAANSVAGGAAGTYVNSSTGTITYGETGALTASGDTNAAVGLSGKGSSAVSGSGGHPAESYLTVPRSVFTGVGTGAFSIEMWFNAKQIGGGVRQDLIEYKGSPWEITVMLEKDRGTLYTYVSGATGGSGTSETAYKITAGDWFHLALTRDTTGVVRTYLNGALVPDDILPSFADSLLTTGDIYIGTNYYTKNNYGNYFGFGGSIDELAIYNTQLTDGQILAHYNAGVHQAPEPISLVLISSALIGLSAYAWRKRREN